MPKGRNVSLHPLTFDEAMGKLIAAKPTEKKKRKGRKKGNRGPGTNSK